MIARADALAALAADEFDVLVIGGGVTGAGVALDAASRGYSVALVERHDYAEGTSSRSSKLVHGGLRYLQNFDLGLVREALLERQLMVNLAPHLVRPLPLLIPAFDGQRPDRVLGVGLNMYDVMASDRRLRRGGDEPRRRRRDDDYWSPDRHRTVDADETLRLLPALAAREPTAAYLFYDCQTDDSRLVLTILGEAERYGAVLANAVAVTGLVERGGRAGGALCRDALDGGEFEIRAANVVNATGVWADRIRPDGEKQGQLVVRGGFDASSQRAQPTSLGEEPGKEWRNRPTRGHHRLLREGKGGGHCRKAGGQIVVPVAELHALGRPP